MLYGCEDSALEIRARMHGWETRTFSSLEVMHNGPVGGRGLARVTSGFRHGIARYTLGYGGLFMFCGCCYGCRSVSQMTGSLAMLTGYLWGLACHKEKAVSPECVIFLRKEQKMRLRQVFRL